MAPREPRIRKVQSSTGAWAAVPVWVLSVGLKGNELAVYVGLRSFADREGHAHPHIKTIAKRAGVSHSTAKRALQRLVDLDLVFAEMVFQEDSNAVAGCDYTFNDIRPVGTDIGSDSPDPDVTQTRPSGQSEPTSGHTDTTVGSPADPTVGSPADPTKEHTNEHTNEPTTSPPSATGDEHDGDVLDLTRSRRHAAQPDSPEFETFWATYPRKIAKAKARAAWAKVLKKIDAQTVIDGAAKYAASRIGADVQYTAHPATWLNGERWTDDVVQAAPPPGERVTRANARYIGDVPFWEM